MRIHREGTAVSPSPRDVAVGQAAERLIREWMDDPERLAVAVYAYEVVLGYSTATWALTGMSDEVAYAIINRALYRRNRRVLRARAEGLVLALQAVAEDAEAWRLHGVRQESAVIECRELPIEERLAKLREMETADV